MALSKLHLIFFLAGEGEGGGEEGRGREVRKPRLTFLFLRKIINNNKQ